MSNNLNHSTVSIGAHPNVVVSKAALSTAQFGDDVAIIQSLHDHRPCFELQALVSCEVDSASDAAGIVRNEVPPPSKVGAQRGWGTAMLHHSNQRGEIGHTLLQLQLAGSLEACTISGRCTVHRFNPLCVPQSIPL